MQRALLVAIALLAACGSNSPTAPPPTPTGTIGARIDSACSQLRFGVTTVTVTIDGTVAGTASPGGAVTRVVPVGSHTISGRSQNGITWGGETTVTTAANPDAIKLFACV
jgi:hypothetical protein